MKKIISLFLTIICLNIFCPVSVFAQQRLFAGTKADLELQKDFSDNTEENAKVTFQLTKEYYEDIYPGEASFPEGTVFIGTVEKVQNPRAFNKNALIVLNIKEAKLPDEKYMPLKLKIVKVNGQKINADTLKGKKIFWQKFKKPYKEGMKEPLEGLIIAGFIPPLMFFTWPAAAFIAGAAAPVSLINASIKPGSGITLRKGTVFTVEFTEDHMLQGP